MIKTGDASGGVLNVLWKRRRLVYELARREIGERYAGQVLGMLWAVGHPLILMSVYVFVFAYVFKMRIGGTAELPLDYTAYILSGVIPWMAMQEMMNKTVSSITGNATLVKQVVFPLEVLPVKTILASLFGQIVSLGVLAVYILVASRSLPWTFLLVPVLLILQVIALSGLGFLLASLGVYLRDLKDAVQVFGVIGLYILPVLYLPQWVPSLFVPALYVNPFSYVIWAFQDACYFGRFEHPLAWVVFPVGSILLFFLGHGVFNRLKTMFGNVL